MRINISDSNEFGVQGGEGIFSVLVVNCPGGWVWAVANRWDETAKEKMSNGVSLSISTV